MGVGHHAYMKKDDVINKVPMNEWARYRRSGYTFSNEDAYNKQQAKLPAEERMVKKEKVKKKMRHRSTVA